MVMVCSSSNALELEESSRSLLRSRVQDKLQGNPFKKWFQKIGEGVTAGTDAIRSIGKKKKRSGKDQNVFEKAFIRVGNSLSHGFKAIGSFIGKAIGPVIQNLSDIDINDPSSTPIGRGPAGCSSVIVNAFCDSTDCDPCNALGVIGAELITRTILAGYVKNPLTLITSRNSMAYAARCVQSFAHQCGERLSSPIFDQESASLSQLDVKENECIHMAVAQYGRKVTARRSGLVAGSWNTVPFGCSVQSGGDFAAHFNRNWRMGDRQKSGYSKVNKDDTVVTEDDCLLSALVTYGPDVTARRSSLVAGSWKHVPLGCSVQTGGDMAAHFNRIDGRREDGVSYTKVVKPPVMVEIEEEGYQQLDF